MRASCHFGHEVGVAMCGVFASLGRFFRARQIALAGKWQAGRVFFF
jgi:hypothetical protein